MSVFKIIYFGSQADGQNVLYDPNTLQSFQDLVNSIFLNEISYSNLISENL